MAGLGTFQAYCTNLPRHFDEEHIREYHSHIFSLESASAEVLNAFRIPPDEVKPEVVSVSRRSWRGAPGRVQYSSKKYCDPGYAKHKIQALSRYLKDWEAEAMASEYRLPDPGRERTDSSERISKAPRPPSEVGGCGAIHEPKPTEVLSDLPVNYPRTLVVRTLVIIAEAVRKFSVQTETLELSKYVISELTPHFREALQNKVLRLCPGCTICFTIFWFTTATVIGGGETFKRKC